MDPLVPGGGLAAAVARSAVMSTRDELLEKLKIGEWTYPETKNDKVNASAVFDIVFLVGFLLVWGWSLFGNSLRSKLTRESFPTNDTLNKFGLNDGTTDRPAYNANAIIDYCLKGNFNGNKNFGLFKYVGFFTMEEVTNWLSVSFVSTLVLIKIICGSTTVNPASILLVVITGVVARHMRLGIKGASDSKPWKQLPPFLLLVSLLFALWSYTDVWRFRVVNTGSENHGQNTLYIGAGIFFLVAAIAKTYISTGNVVNMSGEEHEDKARALYDGEFAFYLTGLSTAIVGACITLFVFCETIFIAYAATKYYAIPFIFLHFIPLYFFVTSLTMTCGSGARSTSTIIVYNVLLVLVGWLTLFFAQGHVCSFPGPHGKHIVMACGDLANMGFKELGDNASKLEIHRWGVECLGAFAVLTHILLYLGARYSRYGLMQTIDTVCIKAGDTKYSVL